MLKSKLKGLDDFFAAGYTPENLLSKVIPADVYLQDLDSGSSADSADFADGTWSSPTSLDAVSVPGFPVNTLPEAMGAYVGELSRATQTPPILAASIGLGALSVALAKKIVIEPRPGWEEPSVLWMLVLLPSGERKTAVMKDMRGPFDKWEREKRKEIAPKIAEAEAKKEILLRRKKKAEENAAKGDSGAQELALEIARELAEHEIPSLPQLTTSDTTEEGGRALVGGERRSDSRLVG